MNIFKVFLFNTMTIRVIVCNPQVVVHKFKYPAIEWQHPLIYHFTLLILNSSSVFHGLGFKCSWFIYHIVKRRAPAESPENDSRRSGKLHNIRQFTAVYFKSALPYFRHLYFSLVPVTPPRSPTRAIKINPYIENV